MLNLPHRRELIFRVSIGLPVHHLFDYLAPALINPDQIQPGIRLLVPFAKSQKIAFLIECTDHSDLDSAKLKRVEQILDEKSLLSKSDLALIHWASRYYHHPLGEVLSCAFPVMLRQGKTPYLAQDKHYTLTERGKQISPEQLARAPKQLAMLKQLQQQVDQPEGDQHCWNQNDRAILNQLIRKDLVQFTDSAPIRAEQAASLTRTDPIRCNDQQQQAIDTVCRQLGRFAVYLLEGVTGSGKTEVYMQIIHRVLAQGHQVLVLLPEITLTPQLENRFRQRFTAEIAISHSQLTDRQRAVAWLKIQRGECSILLGTRSALFTPFKNLGLIILDEEHDVSFKQQEGFRYSTRDVAVMRGKLTQVPVILGSATPALESLLNVDSQRYEHLQLPERAGNARPPQLQILDIRNKRMQEGLAEALIGIINKTLDRKEQVLLFLNRRGYAPTLICHSCGWVAHCRQCDANLVIHFDEKQLRCHHCGQEQPLMKSCTACGHGELVALGLGTERIEKALAELFPNKVVVRLDRDSTQKKGSLGHYLDQIASGDVDIILGTQMLAKGHHFPNVTLVAILDVDSGLFSIDFRATERLAQMIVQVSGRAGRADKSGQVVLQTRYPNHPLLTTLINQGYGSFARVTLQERKLALLPPFSFQALFRAQSKNPEQAKMFLHAVAELANQQQSHSIQILGPVAAPMIRRSGYHRYQLLFQGNRRPHLHRMLDNLIPQVTQMKTAKKVQWSLDVDPIDLY